MYILAVGGFVTHSAWTHVFGFVFTPNPLPDKSQGFLSPPGFSTGDLSCDATFLPSVQSKQKITKDRV